MAAHYATHYDTTDGKESNDQFIVIHNFGIG